MAGKDSINDLHYKAAENKSSPLHVLSIANGKHITKAELHVRKQGEEQVEYYTVTLDGIVIVTSYQSGGHAGGNTLPMDQFSLGYAKIKFDYKAQDEAGKAGAPVTFTWDLKAGVK